MELEQSLDRIRKQGLGVAAISYDSQEILKHFSERVRISYPLLSDADSSIIRSFGVFNPNFPPGHPWHGVPFPGTYIVDTEGRVLAKYFEQGHRQRTTTETILTKEFGVGGALLTEITTRHLKIRAQVSQQQVRPGNRLTLTLEIEMAPKMHVYAPGVVGYTPVSFHIDSGPEVWAHGTEFPDPEILYLPAIEERVPVFQGRVGISRDVTVSPRLRDSQLRIVSQLEYQACDDRVCYPPTKVPLPFTLHVEPHDNERVPEAIQRKPAPM